MNEQLIFSTNWNNKLQCTCFSTIRLRNDKRYMLNKSFDIVSRAGSANVDWGKARIVSITHFRLSQLTEAMAFIDTAYGRSECQGIIRTIYKNIVSNFETQDFSFIILKKI